MDELLKEAFAGRRRAIARLISLLEDDEPSAREALARLYLRAGQARIVGVTGPPGSGKSTLILQMAREYRRHGLTVGIIAVDPTSPFSGGALLGDRIRMQALSADPGVFLRSMASRGSLGGLARAVSKVVWALDACGYRRILVETVGTGQAEVDIARLAHTTVVIQVPGLGDDIQALKAGILEIADIVVVNKADLPGAERALSVLRTMLSLSSCPSSGWQPPLLETVAITSEGVSGLIGAVERHMAYLSQSGRLRAREQMRVLGELEEILREELFRRARARWGEARYCQIVQRLMAHQLDPYTAVEELLKDEA